MLRLSSLLLLSALVSTLSAAPAITSVANAASNISLASPLAQGAIFVIYGSGLGPSTIAFAPAAFQSSTLSGTSVAVTVGATTVSALMYYTSAKQVAALLPSDTPTGSATITVTYQGEASNTLTVGVVANNLGVFSLDSSGAGPGIVTYADYSLVSAAKASPCGGPNTACGAANPGDTLILWGTGLGPITGSDAMGAGLGVNMPDIPLTLWLGGVQAPVTYQGRSGCCIGEDQIVFTVPNNVPTGCAVPLVVQIDNHISNTTVMPVAALGDRNCTPTNPAFAAANVEQVVMAGPLMMGNIGLQKIAASSGAGYQDMAFFEFFDETPRAGSQPFYVSYTDIQPVGTCRVYNGINADKTVPNVGSTNLDAGSSFMVTGPNGTVAVTGQPGDFSATLSAAGTFLVPGAFTVTGSGGANVGAINANITVPNPPTLVSPMSASGLTVTRSSPMTVTWTGGDPNGTVQFQLASATDGSYTAGADAQCTAPASAGTFTIPTYVLLALPAGNFGRFQFSPAVTMVPFTATGLNLGILSTSSAGTSFSGFTLQ